MILGVVVGFLVGGTVGSWVARIQRRREEEASLDRCLDFYEQRISKILYPEKN